MLKRTIEINRETIMAFIINVRKQNVVCYLSYGRVDIVFVRSKSMQSEGVGYNHALGEILAPGWVKAKSFSHLEGVLTFVI